MAQKHMDYQCEQCNHRTTDKALLQKHMKQVHKPSVGIDKSPILEAESPRELSCNICDYESETE